MVRQSIARVILVCHREYSSICYRKLLDVAEYRDLEKLKYRFGVTQGHWKSHDSTDRIRVPMLVGVP